MPSSSSTTPATPTNNLYRHEEGIAKEFGNVIQKRKTLAGNKSPLSWSDKLYILQHLERKDAWYYGMAAGLGTFWVLGRVRGVVRGRFPLQQQPKPVSPFRTATATTTAQQQPSWFFTTRVLESPVIHYTLDGLVGGWVGMHVALWTMDSMEKQRVIADLPLQPGRSGIADQLCGVLVKEYMRQWKMEAKEKESGISTAAAVDGTTTTPAATLTRRQTLKQPQREDLQILFRFIQNCQKRQTLVERQQHNRAVEMDGASGDASLGGNQTYSQQLSFSDDNRDDVFAEDVSSSLVVDQEDSRF